MIPEKVKAKKLRRPVVDSGAFQRIKGAHVGANKFLWTGVLHPVHQGAAPEGGEGSRDGSDDRALPGRREPSAPVRTDLQGRPSQHLPASVGESAGPCCQGVDGLFSRKFHCEICFFNALCFSTKPMWTQCWLTG